MTQAAEKVRPIPAAKTFLLPFGKEFFLNVLGAINDGCEILFSRYETSDSSSHHTILRCDQKKNMFREQEVNGKTYPSWADFCSSIVQKKCSVLYTLNSFYGNKRSVENIHSFQNIYVDVDRKYYPVDIKTAILFTEALITKLRRDNLPIPYVVHSGGGVHLIFPICSVPKQGNEAIWSCVENAMLDYVQNFVDDLDFMTGCEVDKKACSGAQLFRLPGSFNFKVRRYSHLLITPATPPCTLSDFADSLDVSPDEKSLPQNNKMTVDTKRDSRSMKNCAEARVTALKKFADESDCLIGIRNQFALILMSQLFTANPKTAEKRGREILRNIKNPQCESEISKVIRCCRKKHYKFTDKKIIETLCMTQEEAQQYLHICSDRAKTVKKKSVGQQNIRRNMERAERKAEKQKKYARIPELRKLGYTFAEIADMLKISLRTAKRYSKNPVEAEKTNPEPKMNDVQVQEENPSLRQVNLWMKVKKEKKHSWPKTHIMSDLVRTSMDVWFFLKKKCHKGAYINYFILHWAAHCRSSFDIPP